MGCFEGSFFSCWYLEWCSKVVLEASRLDFDYILEGLGSILGGFLEGVWRVCGGWAFLEIFAVLQNVLRSIAIHGHFAVGNNIHSVCTL